MPARYLRTTSHQHARHNSVESVVVAPGFPILRRCLKCNLVFSSTGPFHRLCDNCHKTNRGTGTTGGHDRV